MIANKHMIAGTKKMTASGGVLQNEQLKRARRATKVTAWKQIDKSVPAHEMTAVERQAHSVTRTPFQKAT
jgi:ABC-type phosphate transport system substrate-binding protein